MSKDLYIAAHEELIGEYLERHPNATEAEAYDKCADRAYDHMVDKLADRADMLRKERQEQGYTCVKPLGYSDWPDNGVEARREMDSMSRTEGDTCGDCGVGAGEHAADCPRLQD
jgi:hypothetical protein